jgi:cytochrome c553
MRSVLLVLNVLFFASLHLAWANPKLDPNIPRVATGQGLYSQSGANSCLYCHGVEGTGGTVKAAAKLNNPKSWKIYKILGGDAAFKKDPAKFKEHMKEATVHIMLKGAIAHNSSFKRDWFDLSKAGSTYDGQMVGMTGAPSRAWLKRFGDKYGIKQEVAAESLYLYLQTLDKNNIL